MVAREGPVAAACSEPKHFFQTPHQITSESKPRTPPPMVSPIERHCRRKFLRRSSRSDRIRGDVAGKSRWSEFDSRRTVNGNGVNYSSAPLGPRAARTVSEYPLIFLARSGPGLPSISAETSLPFEAFHLACRFQQLFDVPDKSPPGRAEISDGQETAKILRSFAGICLISIDGRSDGR